jgi:ribosome-associated translation inhibitor RaiA
MFDIHLDLNGIEDAQEARLNAYWEKKRAWLEKALIPYRNGIRDVRLTVSHERKQPLRSWYEVRGVINLLSDHQLLAEDEGKNPEDALDRVVDELYQGIKRHREFVRRDHISRRNARNRADLNASGARRGRTERSAPLLAGRVAAGPAASFPALHAGRLQPHRDRPAPGPPREPGEGGHRGGPTNASRAPAGRWTRAGGTGEPRGGGHRGGAAGE